MESNWSLSWVIFISSFLQDLTLHKAGSPWRPNRNTILQILIKRVRSILNKLTPQNFPTLLKELSEMEINTEERLNCVVDLIFETVSLRNDKVSHVLCIFRSTMNNDPWIIYPRLKNAGIGSFIFFCRLYVNQD